MQWPGKLQQARFTQLLIALSLLLFTTPFIGMFGSELGRSIANVLVVLALATVLIAAALAVSESRRQSRNTVALAGVCLTLTLLANLSDSSALRMLQEVFTIGFLAHVVRLIVRYLFRQRHVDYDSIAASLCGYLLIGVAFAVVFSLVMEIDETAFATGQVDQPSVVAIHFGDRHTATALYFSFVTLTTLGYGDITPVSMLARMLTTVEALFGQLYLVILVARLVGLHISTEMIARRSDAGE
jgi:hypothetical protein